MYYSGVARNNHEADQALDLATHAFLTHTALLHVERFYQHPRFL